ncbi:MAG: DUF4328 domain-containing protein [Hamadaea sp.]|nr:DUF4328 domain-containing protein [Hamadaea sp.]
MYSARSLHRLFLATAIAIGVTSLANIALILPLGVAQLLEAAGAVSAADTLRFTDTLPPVAFTLPLLAMLVSGVLFLAWLGRARRHLNDFAGADPKYSPGWTIGAWFIPLGNMIMPGLVVADLAKASVAPGTPRGRLLGLVWAWWGCWIAQYVFTYASVIVRDLTTASIIDLVSLAFLCAAGVLAVLMMRDLGRAQAARMADEDAAPNPADFPAFTVDDVARPLP